MSDPTHRVSKKISESVDDTKTENNGECENKDILNSSLSAMKPFHCEMLP